MSRRKTADDVVTPMTGLFVAVGHFCPTDDELPDEVAGKLRAPLAEGYPLTAVALRGATTYVEAEREFLNSVSDWLPDGVVAPLSHWTP